ncbi:hypothetical protein [Gulosibacter sp. ACHW.36C]|jgi:hypothetical protein|uniref:Uncharacterized protein n=1 Tax=Gulosibacter sediminis TaxID=1729695 RepID=A0ABY4MYE4_9MICO|nr:hypothetical protein [Gulosibacter sediminis]UQN14227.1 hypothetical protein M3M28_09215 [Gulosibacter sediminis]
MSDAPTPRAADERPESRASRFRIVVVWAVAVVAAVLVGVLASPERQLTWVPIAMLLLLFFTAIMQLIEGKPEGFIHRFALSLTGAGVVMAIASLVFVLMGASATVLNP